MREILFRGKRRDNGEWVEGYLIQKGGETLIARYPYCTGELHETSWLEFCFGGFIEVIPETVGQYTGLTDRNGEKTFEGDILKFREWDGGEMCWIGYVHFEHCQFIISGGAYKECPSYFHLALSKFPSKNIEVIGNIHDNPELLGGKS